MRFGSIDQVPATMQHQVREKLAGITAPRREKTRKPRADKEHNEQVVFFNRIRALGENDPRYATAAARTFAIPNGGGRSKREAGRLKAEGVRAGVSDIFVSVTVPGMSGAGLYIEMKSLIGYPSREQRQWIADSVKFGYEAACCRGADEALRIWKAYVERGFA